ncbi:hypothetical protein [Arcobacter sp. F2176]|uniref:hypothetical protein n=1 Tax=unclassified Arcobacter TaxID=2593671 RepID=UPI00100BA9AA|nr:hypothetical protein [Arcobacter sp. F2176]RXJ81835.1 hypothetical protein CRU95_05705 [Arcobacter sp. F2176]
MEKTSNKWSKYIKIAVVLLILILCYLFIPLNQNNFSNTYSLRSSSKSSDPIKLQFRSGFQYDKYKPPKKSTFMQKQMEDNEEGKKPIFWDNKNK